MAALRYLLFVLFLRTSVAGVASGLWGLHIRSPEHGAIYTPTAPVPIAASLAKPQVKCGTSLECPTPQLAKNAIICFWLNGQLEKCVLVQKLVGEDIRLRGLGRGVYALRAQLFGVSVTNQTYPLSSAQTVSFSIMSTADDVAGAALPLGSGTAAAASGAPRQSPQAATGAPVAAVQARGFPVGCTLLPQCTGDSCVPGSRGGGRMALHVYRPAEETPEAFEQRARDLLVVEGGYHSSALNPDLSSELLRWRLQQLQRRAFQRGELRRLLAQLASPPGLGHENGADERAAPSPQSDLGLVLAGFQPLVQCSAFGFNVTTVGASAAGGRAVDWVFVGGPSLLDPRNSSDISDLLPPHSFQRLLLLPGLWGDLTARQSARLAYT